LCKQPFTSIIHNIQSETLFDQFAIEPQDVTETTEDPTAANARRWADSYSRFQPARRSRSRYRTQPRVAAAVERRQAVYAAQLRVMPEYEERLKVRLRDIAPSAMLLPDTGRRLAPWLERELKVLVGESNVAFVTNYVLSLIQKMDFRCTALVKPILEPFLGRYTEHFLHEFVHYSLSPLDMIAYDQHARYQPPAHRQRRDADRYFRLVDKVIRQQQAEQIELGSPAQDLAAIVAHGDRPPKRAKSHGLNPYGWGHSSEQRERTESSRSPQYDNDDNDDTDRSRSRWDSPSPSPERYLEPATPPRVRAMAREVLQHKREALDQRLCQRQRKPPATNQGETADKVEVGSEPSAKEMAAALRKMSAAVDQRKQRVLHMKMASMQAAVELRKATHVPVATGKPIASKPTLRSTSEPLLSEYAVEKSTLTRSQSINGQEKSHFASRQAPNASADTATTRTSKLLILKARMQKESQHV
jgi:hypothetical protein